jgi:hypothetical protein
MWRKTLTKDGLRENGGVVLHNACSVHQMRALPIFSSFVLWLDIFGIFSNAQLIPLHNLGSAELGSWVDKFAGTKKIWLKVSW